MKKGHLVGAVHGPEQAVLIHGTKLCPTDIECMSVVNGVLNSVKHVTVNELDELVKTIARVNSKQCR
jgi:hypothetical protein